MNKLSRIHSEKIALMRNLASALIHYEKIRTTLPKAKEVRKLAERLINVAREDNLARRRYVLRSIRDKKVVGKLFTVLGPRFKERNGGYTRIVKVGPRSGDGAEMAVIRIL